MDKLCDLLDIRPGVTALIGGGGKTTLMYHLARELRERGTVAVTTTTKIWPPTGIAVAQDPDTAREILAREGLVCLGVPSAQGKLVSPGFEGWDALADYTLVEADPSGATKSTSRCCRPGATPPFWCWEPTASAVPSALRPIVRPCMPGWPVCRKTGP